MVEQGEVMQPGKVYPVLWDQRRPWGAPGRRRARSTNQAVPEQPPDRVTRPATDGGGHEAVRDVLQQRHIGARILQQPGVFTSA
jgi:hypothetical protein